MQASPVAAAMSQAAATLSRAWHREHRRWWRSSAGALALFLAALLLVAGLFSGLESATSSRVADFYTGDLRVTKQEGGVAPDEAWTGEEVEAARLALGPHAHPHLETELILSRRSLVEAYLEEQEQYQVATPGSAVDAATHYGFGVLVGLEPSDPLRSRVAAHLVVGRLPQNGTGPLQLAMGLETFRSYLAPGELANLSAWPPAATELAAFRFEATAGYVAPGGLFKDLVRRGAVVVGLFETGLDALDSLTLVADAAAARSLTGSWQPRANVFTVAGAGEADARRAAAQGWHSETAPSFAGRYLGQLLTTVRSLGLLSVGLFLLVPAFLLWHGLQQLLDRQRREIAVCRAIGVPPRVLSRALGRLSLRVAATGSAAGAVAVAALAFGLPPLFARVQPLPLPLDYRFDPGTAAAALAVVAAATMAAWALARRRAGREPLASALRSA